MSPAFVRLRRRRAGRGPALGLGDRRRHLPPHVARSTFRDLILRLLLAAPEHQLPSRQVRRVLERRLRDRFTPTDLTFRSRAPLWVNEMQWAKKQLVLDGLLEGVLSAGHSVWKLTRHGIQEARSQFA